MNMRIVLLTVVIAETAFPWLGLGRDIIVTLEAEPARIVRGEPLYLFATIRNATAQEQCVPLSLSSALLRNGSRIQECEGYGGVGLGRIPCKKISPNGSMRIRLRVGDPCYNLPPGTYEFAAQTFGPCTSPFKVVSSCI